MSKHSGVVEMVHILIVVSVQLLVKDRVTSTRYTRMRGILWLEGVRLPKN